MAAYGLFHASHGAVRLLYVAAVKFLAGVLGVLHPERWQAAPLGSLGTMLT